MQYLKRLCTFASYVIIAVQLLLTQSAWATPDASTFPQLTGHVVDTAGVLDSKSRQDIDALLTMQEQATGDQIVVVTIPNLGAETVEEYATALFRYWGLGQKDKDNGVLLLFAMDDHKMRIEVGYGLEGELTDANAKLITDDILTPAFKAGDYGTGISLATQEMIDILNADQQYTGALSLPTYQSYFTDSLSPIAIDEREKINQFLDNFYKNTGSKIAVVNTKADAQALRGYAPALFSHWQLSDKDMLLVFNRSHNQSNTIGIRAGRGVRNLLIEKDDFQLLKGHSLTISSDALAELKVQLQQLADALDDNQNYPPLVESTSILPEFGASVLLFCALIGLSLLVSKAFNSLLTERREEKEGVVRKNLKKQSAISKFLIKTPYVAIQCVLIVAIVTVGFSAFRWLASIGSFYPLGDMQARMIGLGESYLSMFHLLLDNVVVYVIIGIVVLVNISTGQSTYHDDDDDADSDDDDDSIYYSSSSSSDYSGGGGSSGGGGASGDW